MPGMEMGGSRSSSPTISLKKERRDISHGPVAEKLPPITSELPSLRETRYDPVMANGRRAGV